jgi:N-acetylneuraminate synthase
MRETPWGYITYLEYRYKVEFNEDQYCEIDKYCREKRIAWMVSVWDQPSVEFMEKFDTPAYKIPSASLTDLGLIRKARRMAPGMVVWPFLVTVECICALLSQSALLLILCLTLRTSARKSTPPERLQREVLGATRPKAADRGIRPTPQGDCGT